MVELRLNGKSLGKKAVKGCKVSFKTKYAPGALEAVAYDASGKEIARHALTSARVAKVCIRPEKKQVRAGELVYVPVYVGDGDIVECNADRQLTVTVEGGELLAFGSANPRTEEVYHTGVFTTYYGQALAIVKAGKSGTMTIRAGETSAQIAVL